MRALVLTGGGSFGAFQAGVLHGLAQQGRRWDLVIGTSVGAINGAYLAQAPAEYQEAQAEALCDLWGTLHQPLIYHMNWKGWLRGIAPRAEPYAQSIFHTRPLSQMIVREISGSPPPTRLLVTAVSLDKGTVHVADAAKTDIRPWVLASSAIPILFPPVEIDGRLWIDGGVRRNNPVAEAIRAGATEVDVVLCYPLKRHLWLQPEHRTKWGLTNVAALSLMYVVGELLNGDVVAWHRHANPPVRIYAPNSVPIMTPVSFRPETIAKMIEHGRDIASK